MADPATWTALMAGAFTAAGTTGPAAVASNVAGFLAANTATLVVGSVAGAAGLVAYGSYAQAQEQQEFAEASARAQELAMGINVDINADQSALEREKAINRAQLIIGRIRVNQGESGLGMGGSAMALMRQADYDAAANIDIINRNERNQYLSIISGRRAPSAPNLAMNTVLGGMSGLSSGLNLGMGIDRLVRGPA